MTFATFTKRLSTVASAALLFGALFAGAPALAETPAADDAPEAQTNAKAGPSLLVDLNTATAAELEQLPGIGPSRAQAILALRTQLKRFNKVEDVMRVKGIGRATFRKLRPMLKVGAQVAQAANASASSTPSAK